MVVEALSRDARISQGLDLANRRIRFIKDTFAGGEEFLYRRRKSLPHFLIRAISAWVVSKAELVGQENLDLIGGKQVTMTVNHTSDPDHGVLEHTLIANGYANVADRLLFAAGLKMWDRWQTHWGMWGMSNFPTAAPKYFRDALRLSRSKQVSDEERKTIKQYLVSMNNLNKASLEAIRPDWESGKAIVVIYPETTRSRDGLLSIGKKETGTYFERGLILPVMIQGAYEVFPPERQPDWGKVLRRELHAVVKVGEPIEAKRLQAPDTKEWLKALEAGPVDFVMSRIAVLNPERVNSSCKPFYKSLTDGIPEGLILKAA